MESIEKNLRERQFRIERAYSNMKWCLDDGHLEGETMWYSIAQDLEEEFEKYVQEVDRFLLDAERLGIEV